MKYKLIAADLDGTLLNSKSDVSEKNLAAIHTLAERGIHFATATGRTFSEIPKKIRDNPDIRYFIHSNGAVVYDKQSNERILLAMSRENARLLFDMLFSCEVHITARHGGECYAESLVEKPEKYYNIDPNHARVISEYAKFPADFKSTVYGFDYIEVVSAYFHSAAERQACYEKINATGFLCAVIVGGVGLEIFHKSAGKGAALYALCDRLGVDYSQSVGVGDSSNDLSLIRAGGLGLAVENASESLKEAANQIICSNDSDVVDYIINNFLS